MQQIPDTREARFSAWTYFFGTGFALGVGGAGTPLSVALHNPALGLGIGAVLGLFLGWLGLKIFGTAYIERIQRYQARKGMQQNVHKPLPFGFFIGEGAALGLAAIGLPLSFIIGNVALGLGIGLVAGLVVGSIVGQLVIHHRNR